eukprot:148954-Pyramimonas_sp.AAC.1
MGNFGPSLHMTRTALCAPEDAASPWRLVRDIVGAPRLARSVGQFGSARRSEWRRGPGARMYPSCGLKAAW